MSDWIVHREPTENDPLVDGRVFITHEGAVALCWYDGVSVGTPWQPIQVPTPYVKSRFEPSLEQLNQILDSLEDCHTLESAREYLRVWIRDWTVHKIKGGQS